MQNELQRGGDSGSWAQGTIHQAHSRVSCHGVNYVVVFMWSGILHHGHLQAHHFCTEIGYMYSSYVVKSVKKNLPSFHFRKLQCVHVASLLVYPTCEMYLNIVSVLTP